MYQLIRVDTFFSKLQIMQSSSKRKFDFAINYLIATLSLIEFKSSLYLLVIKLTEE